jgi:uncharacterized protein
MYESVDQSWSGLNAAMSAVTVTQTARRIADHARAHDLAMVRVVFHGGEPLLSGPETLARSAEQIRREVGPRTTVDCSVQTNGVLITQRCAQVLSDAGIRVGISLDGDEAATDRHRRFRGGRSSHQAATRGLAVLRQFPDIYAGILCVIDLANLPLTTYASLLSHRPPAIDFLLPHGNWTSRPPGRPADRTTPYGDWLVAVFDEWYAEPAPVSIRLFEEMIHGLLGGSSRSESVGLTPVGVIVVDVDGKLEQVDALRTAYPGAVSTQLNIFDHAFDDALRHEAVIARQSGVDALSQTCLGCPIHHACGGGYYPHRYRAGSGFRNPSVYCADLYRVIRHIEDRIRPDLADIMAQPR